MTVYRHTLYLSLSFMIDVCFSFTYPFMCCFFSPLYTCLDEFSLKCFRNIGCQSLLAIKSLLAKFFKSL